MSNSENNQILSTDYQIFLEKVNTVAASLDTIVAGLGQPLPDQLPVVSIVSVVASGVMLLTMEGDNVNLLSFYPLVDSMMTYFDIPKLFYGYSNNDCATEILFSQYILELFQQKTTVLRSDIQAKAAAGTSISDLLHVYEVMQKSINAVAAWVQTMETIQSVVVGRSILSSARSDEINTLQSDTAIHFHTAVKLFPMLDKQQEICSTASKVRKASPFDMYPFLSNCRIADKGTLEEMLKKYGEDVKKIHRKPVPYHPQHDVVLLFHKESNLWSQKPWEKKSHRKMESFAYLMYIDNHEYFFIVHPKPPECFLVVVDHDDFDDCNKSRYKTIFIQGAARITKGMYGMMGVSA